jgi:hypothetical protein
MAGKLKYEGINPLERLHLGEPWFFIRAQDKLSVDAVIAYSKLLQIESNKAAQEGKDDLAVSLSIDAAHVMNFAHNFLNWQEANPDKVKLPD